jgi:hypothetical protein
MRELAMKRFQTLCVIIILLITGCTQPEHSTNIVSNQSENSDIDLLITETQIAKTSTISPTPTIILPTNTKTPSPTATIVPTEDYSDLIPCKSIPEALTDECYVTYQDITSGRLLRMAKSIATPSDIPSYSPFNIYADRNSDSLPYKNLLIFRYKGIIVDNYIVIIQQWKNKDGSYSYLQYVSFFSDCDGRCPQNNVTIDILRKKNILPRIYYKPCEQYSDLKNTPWDEIHLEDDLTNKYAIETHCKTSELINQWNNTGIIPEALSEYPLEIDWQP